MGARGPKAVSEAGFSPFLPGRPAPIPDDLDPDERRLFVAIVDRLPSDWLMQGACQELLKQYCRHAAAADRVAAELRRLQDELGTDPKAWRRYSHLMRLMGAQSDKLASLATKMRLCPSSRYRAENAAADVFPNGRRPPWQDWGNRGGRTS